MAMKIILSKNVEKLGVQGDVLDIKKGYARNFLIPQGLALVATSQNLKKIEMEKERERKKKEQAKREAELLAAKVQKTSCTISAQTGEEGTLFGSVTREDIEEVLKAKDIVVDSKAIELPEPIKKLGVYEVPIRLHPEITAEIKLWVIKE